MSTTPSAPRLFLLGAALAVAFAAPGTASTSSLADLKTPPEHSALWNEERVRMVLDREPNHESPRLSAMGCVAGKAGTYPCSNVDLESYLPLSDIGGGSGNDIWGWTDPTNGKEYALFGRSTGTSFIDISDPQNPVYLGDLPTHTVASTWRDIKVYKDHAFVVSEATNHGLQVFDLTQLRNVPSPPVTFSETAYYDGFGDAHNLVINEDTGFAYAVGSNTCAGGLHIVNIQNPVAPVAAGCFADDGYTHDAQCVIYRGPDAAYRGREICFAFNEDTVTIVDVTDKANLVQIARAGYTNSRYTHQGWLTPRQDYLLMDDELDESRLGLNTTTHIWDLTSLAAPVHFSVYTAGNRAIDHNVYTLGRLAFEANYRSGLRILDIACMGTGILTEVGFFDIYPLNDNTNFNGAWSTFPYHKSGVVTISGIEQGLFVVRPRLSLSGPVATGAATKEVCPGTTTTLSGAPSLGCSAAGVEYRWLDGQFAELCGWSSAPTCDVTPSQNTSYELQVRCLERRECLDQAAVTLAVGTKLTADAAPDVTLCLGSTARLDAATHPTCPLADTRYRWLISTAEICPWSDNSSCDVRPSGSLTYTLEVACASSFGCTSRDQQAVVIDPALIPPSLGNSLLAVKQADDVMMSWRTEPLARSYALYRSEVKQAWPGSASRPGLSTPSDREPDVPPASPTLYYRVVGANCAGAEGL